MQTSVQLALIAMAAVGVADYAGGTAVKRDGRNETIVPINAAIAASVMAVVVLVYVMFDPPAEVRWRDVAWAGAAGIGVAFTRPLLMLGISRGPISVFSPLQALVSVALPVVVGTVYGRALSKWELIGVLVALPAALLIASPSGVPRWQELRHSRSTSLALGVGMLVGVVSVCLAQASDAAEAMPAVVVAFVSLVVMVPLVYRVGGPLRPRHGAAWFAALNGLLSSVALVALARAYQVGSIVVTAMIFAFAPGVTVLLARVLRKEVLHPTQLAGLGLGALATLLMTGAS